MCDCIIGTLGFMSTCKGHEKKTVWLNTSHANHQTMSPNSRLSAKGRSHRILHLISMLQGRETCCCEFREYCSYSGQRSSAHKQTIPAHCSEVKASKSQRNIKRDLQANVSHFYRRKNRRKWDKWHLQALNWRREHCLRCCKILQVGESPRVFLKRPA